MAVSKGTAISLLVVSVLAIAAVYYGSTWIQGTDAFRSAIVGAVVAGAFTLIGGLAGAIYVGSKDDQREKRRGDSDSHAGATMIIMELIHNQTILQAFVESKAWQPDLLRRAFWESEGPKVAGRLNPEQLVDAGMPYLHIQALEALAASFRARNVPEGMSGSEASDLKRIAVDSCGAAIASLRSAAELSDPDFHRLQKAAST